MNRLQYKEYISDSDSDSSSSDVSTSEIPDVSMDDGLLESAGFVPGAFPLHIDGFETFQHNLSGVIHRRVNTAPEKFLCSRIVTATYTRIQGMLKFEWPLCPQCASKLERLQTSA
jgi:hypothetical protein